MTVRTAHYRKRRLPKRRLTVEQLEDRCLLTSNTSGFPDPTFDDDGRTIIDLPGFRKGVVDAALQDDGKIVVLGWIETQNRVFDTALVRLNSDGSFNQEFGQDGILIDDLGDGQNEVFTSLVIQPDGQLVIAGSSFNPVSGSQDAMLARFNPDGTLDPGFGDGGITLAGIPGFRNESVLGMTRQPDGKLVVTGTTESLTVNGHDIFVGRFNVDGTLDPTFDQDGWATTDIAGENDEARAIAIQPDGKLVVAGRSPRDAAVIRYTTNGALDTSFGTGGIVVTDAFTDGDELRDVVVQPDGKIVVAGSAGSALLARYEANGVPDDTFGTDGLLHPHYGNANNGSDAWALTLQADGKILITGSEVFGTTTAFWNTGLARFNPDDGARDQSFGINGAAVPNPGNLVFPRAIALQDDGAIIVAGTFGATRRGQSERYFVERYIGDTGPTDPPEPPPLGLNQWWNTAGEEPMDVTWTLEVPTTREYTLDVNIGGDHTWALAPGAHVIIDGNPGDPKNFIGGLAPLGELTTGTHQLTIQSFAVPTTAVVEPVSFELRLPTGEGGTIVNRLGSLFIADWPQSATDELFANGGLTVDGIAEPVESAQQLANAFAPILHFDNQERYAVPLDIEGLLEDVKQLNGDELYQDHPRGSSEDYINLSNYHFNDDVLDALPPGLFNPDNTPSAIYASVLPIDDEIVIDYFFVYHISNWSQHDGANTHHGDLEGMAFKLRESNGVWSPYEVVFSQHTVIDQVPVVDRDVGGEVFSWDSVERQGLQTSVYVGLGGHASYPSPGRTWVQTLGGRLPESHDGKGISYDAKLRDEVKLVDRIRDASAEWLQYPGFWGHPDLGDNGDFPVTKLGDMAPKGMPFQQIVANAATAELEYGNRWRDPINWSRNFSRDTDGDGISDEQEGKTDRNGDGEDDFKQPHVASVRHINTDEFVTLVTSDGRFENVNATQASGSLPAGVGFPIGAFEYRITGLTPGQEVTVTYLLPSGVTVNTLLKQQNDGSWADFLAHTDVLADRLIVHLKDGGFGDANKPADGIIVDPAAPAFQEITSNVEVSARHKQLRLIGDMESNTLSVTQLDHFTYQVIGLAGTTINGSTDPLVVSSVRWGMNARLQGGNDRLFIHDADFRGVTRIITGSGDDTVSLSNVRLRGLANINTGQDNDTIAATDSLFTGLGLLQLGDGDDTATFIRSRLRGVGLLDGGNDDDLLDVLGLNVRGLLRHHRFEIVRK